MKPRAHPFQMKYMLAKFALESPAQFFDTFDPAADASCFSNLWKDCGEEFEPAERVGNAGTAMWRSSASPGSPEILVLTFPAPEAAGEAYFVGAVRVSESECRVFCLEHSTFSAGHEVATMLSELAPEGRLNWGPGPNPTVQGFVTRVREITSDTAASPVSFLPIKLV